MRETITSREAAGALEPEGRGSVAAGDTPLLTELLPLVSYSRRVGGDFPLTHVSPSCVEVTGYAPSDFLHAPEFWSDRLHPTDAGAAGAFHRLLRDGELETEYRFLVADGSYRWLRDVCRLVHQPGGERWVMGIWRDVTPRKVVEEELRRQRELFRLAFEHAPLAIVTCSPEGRFLSANQAARELFGYPGEELMALSIDDVTHPEDRGQGLELARRVPPGEGVSFAGQKRYVKKDGSVFRGEVRVSAAWDEAGRPVLYIGQVEDLTLRLEREQEALSRRERLAHVARLGTLGEMAAGIAHEINQPLTAIANYTQACRRFVTAGRAETSGLVETLDKVSAQARRAGEVIRRLRDLVRKRETCRDLVEVDALVADVVKLAELDARLQGLAIRLDLGAAKVRVVADAVQIQQVVLNLIRNGMDASLEAGRPAPGRETLAVRTRRRRGEDAVEVEVEDHGAGLPPEVAEKIFDPFFSTKPSGMGLGLSISRSIVASHGGRLGFTSTPGGGTVFCFTLPTSLDD